MNFGSSNFAQSKASLQSRRGIASVELMIALPLITAAFATLMFVAHASHKKNGDYHRMYVTGMSRHTLQPPKFDSPQVTTNFKRTSLGRDQNLVQSAFPDTQIWATTVSQPLEYVPGNFQEGDWETSEFAGALYKGTGSPEFRTPNMISPSEDKVKALAISALVDSVGNKLGINLSQANEFLTLLGALTGNPASSDFDQHMGDAREELQNLREEKQELEQEKQKPEEDKRKLEEELQQYIDQQFGDVEQDDSVVNRLNNEIGDLQKRINEFDKQINELDKQINASRRVIDGIQRDLNLFTQN